MSRPAGRYTAPLGMDDLDKLVQKFIDAENQNFTHFKYNTEFSANMFRRKA